MFILYSGDWGSPQSAFGYPNAMLAKRVPPVSVSPGRPASDLFRFFDLYQSIECRTNDMESVCHTDFGIHCSCHFFSTYDYHPASPQKDMRHPSISLHVFRISFFEERRKPKPRTDRYITQFIDFSAIFLHFYPAFFC